MTQPPSPAPNPGQPYIPPSSAPSAPGTYNPQQQFAGAPQTAQYAPAGAMPPQSAAGGSLFSNLFDASRAFASRYGTIVMIVGTVGYVLLWLYAAYSTSSIGNNNLDVGRFLVNLLMNAPKACVDIFLLRLVLEIAARIGGPGGRQG
ncbi:hypothetical protein [Actinomyces gerencseriae]|uniref:hypothetical protein n=1 Tax=Actinomyces gerencseriae TaxID=52769 RepID=UPI0023F0ED07|nr:hypothetical protein [Actinomyces gerencseriae]